MASFDEVKLEDILHGSFATYNPNTGANKDADSTPTIAVYEEGSSTALTVTASVTNITTGRYRWQLNVAAADGFEQGKYYEVWISATVTGTDTVAQSAPVMSFKATAKVIDDITTSVFTTQMTESYAADGVAPTLAQAIFLIQQAITEFAITVNTGSGTSTTTIKKLDGSTSAATLTLNSETAPTSATRAT